ncbi:ABC-type nitrate/sulfonate/bicarbonate transport system ATPase component [Methanonatronarchaeum thermophilum]|uniref:Molybdate/tungstate import ATP-binding protein WtpC n=1 Tax=Methanonatronarchaeum thermophilum TaxID=1927129 RepID=A0A1Y3GDH0_9EURY|nr:ABC transporter ATP-binding protein [Methanonatronarchaeum thermophilum]OUJ19501.1 ABC-type nitrate/sulfonate/bicarbonate transport system ATPase component [Methanonatronarchaeum thermophilum]
MAINQNQNDIEIKNLNKTYNQKKPIKALQNVNLTIKQGEFTCLVGPSGCGKSTLLRIIAGLEQPTKGKTLIQGKPIKKPTPKTGLVFQEYTLFPWRTVTQNIEFGLEIQNTPKKQRKKIAKQYTKLVGLQGFEDNYPHQLSGGMKQRVSIARTLANNPTVLLMDEPFGALDAQTRNQMQKELLKIWQKTKKTILFVTHNVDEAVYLADKITIMTQRPGTIKNTIKINLPRERDRTSPQFNNYRTQILNQIQTNTNQKKPTK